ncbi:MAG: RNB domain-containing ribonuclease [Thermoanaerobaculia bacterium]
MAELAYNEYSVASAWAAWQLVDDGLYFSGTPDAITARSEAEVTAERAAREAKAAEQLAWISFLQRVEAGESAPEDDRYVQDVINLALGQRQESQVLRALKQAETQENAHALLLKLGTWDINYDPYPARAGLPATSANALMAPLLDEARRDLTHLTALAIDDHGSLDPDDALSWENGRLWVHIADAAALILPGSPADLEGRARGANLYLPQGTATMLPPLATQILALGLQDTSPALSFALDLNDAGEIINCEIMPSRVRVTRMSYREAETRLEETPLRQLLEVAQVHEARRRDNGAIHIDLPEVKVHVEDGIVELQPILK